MTQKWKKRSHAYTHAVRTFVLRRFVLPIPPIERKVGFTINHSHSPHTFVTLFRYLWRQRRGSRVVGEKRRHRFRNSVSCSRFKQIQMFPKTQRHYRIDNTFARVHVSPTDMFKQCENTTADNAKRQASMTHHDGPTRTPAEYLQRGNLCQLTLLSLVRSTLVELISESRERERFFDQYESDNM